MDMQRGGRVVFRYNTVRYGFWETTTKPEAGWRVPMPMKYTTTNCGRIPINGKAWIFLPAAEWYGETHLQAVEHGKLIGACQSEQWTTSLLTHTVYQCVMATTLPIKMSQVKRFSSVNNRLDHKAKPHGLCLSALFIEQLP